MPAIRDGDKVLVIDRKLFHDDNTRFFVGVVEEYDDGVVRVRGYPFHLSPYEVTGIERHGEERVRVIAVSGDILLYLLPRETEITKMQMRRSPKSLQMTDGGEVTVDLTEWLMRV
ncbi:MAG TPA: hypothetical protein VFB33_16635 [Candidatus Binataceae bacterium]|jgi:hypothetical protein|nr:hypothetical protein [Candidatus Binataceae bacterium]